MDLIRGLYGVWLGFCLSILICQHGYRICGYLPLLVLIHLAKVMKLYDGVITEILLCSIVLLFNNVPKVLIPYMLDRLTYIMLDLILILKKSTTLKKGDVAVGFSILTIMILVSKVFFIIVVRHSSNFVMLLLYSIFVGDMSVKLYELL